MILFLDTETSGLPLNYGLPFTDLANWSRARLVQIGWILCDDERNVVSKQEWLVIPEGFTIPADMIHGITDEYARANGSPLKTVLSEFAKDAAQADMVVGHNLSFDWNVIGAEFLRCELPNPLIGKSVADTMKQATNFCAIPSARGFKYPKLAELYFKLFNEPMGDAHNALIDIENTAKCFYALVERGVIQGEQVTA